MCDWFTEIVTASVKTRQNSVYILLHFEDLNTQLYSLAKFHLYILKTLKVTVLKISSNRKIGLYSKYRENKLWALTKTEMEWSTDLKVVPSYLP